MRTDPTDTGGLFTGRRPGTAPIRYRELPERGSETRRQADELFAVALLIANGLVNLTFWGPIPLAWLWVGAQVDYEASSIEAGILTAFLGMLFTLLGGLIVMKRLDQAWILVRRAAGHDQRTGMLGRIFVVTAALGAAAFTFWLLIIAGPGSSVLPKNA